MPHYYIIINVIIKYTIFIWKYNILMNIHLLYIQKTKANKKIAVFCCCLYCTKVSTSITKHSGVEEWIGRCGNPKIGCGDGLFGKDSLKLQKFQLGALVHFRFMLRSAELCCFYYNSHNWHSIHNWIQQDTSDVTLALMSDF